jgi:hypothetical protein
MKTTSLFVCLCASAVGAQPILGQSGSTAYIRKVVAKTGDTIGGKTLTNVGQPVLNRRGEIAFIAFAPGMVGVFTPERLVAQTGDSIDGATLTGIAGPPAMSDKGLIVFSAATNRGTGIFSPSGAIVETGARIDGKLLTNPGPARLSDKGVLAFLSEFNGGRGIFSRSELIAQIGSSVDGKILTQVGFAPAVNDRGTVAVLGLYGESSGIFTAEAGFLVKTGDVIDGKTLTRVTLASINNQNALVFIGFFNGGSGIFKRSRLLAQSGSTIAGKRLGGFGTVAVNDGGMVAFTSLPDYTSPDCRLCNGVFTPSSVVAYTGDVIGGKTLSAVGHDIAINDAGEIVFAAVFTDGSTAIVLAQPKEMTLWTLLGR